MESFFLLSFGDWARVTIPVKYLVSDIFPNVPLKVEMF